MKNFDKWNEEKKKIDSLKYENFYVNVREKVMDKKRFTDKIWYVGKNEFDEIKEKLRDFLL